MIEGVTHNSKELIDNLIKSDDPMKELGPGISSFHRLIILLSVLFLILFFIHFPVLKSFRSFNYYSENDGWIVHNSLGNLGFSKTECSSSSMITGNFHNLNCKTGNIDTLVDWGIISSFEDSLTCKRQDNNICGPVLND